ncbi:MAG TPA: metallopeptidase family protein [Dehalococcoidales bacterium]|nr:metallopeptidase family protein [Dehalococcoidales bacterium]
MDSEKFEGLVARAIDGLPEEFRERLENIDVVVADEPTRAQLRVLGGRRGETLLGLYEGVPLTRRTHGYGFVMPDKVTIFKKPIEAICKNDGQIIAEVKRVVQHEIAHHFGISDDRLRQLGRD